MKRSGIKIGVVIIIFCTLFGLTGCWDVRDISRIAFVTAIGLDKSQISDGYYRVTFEIIAPEKLKSGKRPATIIEAVDGQSIGEAVEKLQTRMPRVINFDHFRALIVGEEQCKEDFRDIISYVQKNIDIALRFRIGLVQNGRAEDILNYKPRFHRTIAGEYVALTELEKDISLSFGGAFYKFMQDMQNNQGNGLACRVTKNDQGQMMVRHGSAVFKNWKVVGWLSNEEIQEANWIMDHNPTTVIASKKGQTTYTYHANRKAVHINPEVTKGKISFTLRINVMGDIIEQKGEHEDLSKLENVASLEKILTQDIEQQVKQALDKSQNYFGVDYLGLGHELYKKNPQVFRQLDWNAMYPQVPVRVIVQAKIDTFGAFK